MNQQQFLTRAKAGEQVYIIEKLSTAHVTLKIANDVLDQVFSSREQARQFGQDHGLNPYNWQAISNSSGYPINC